MFRLYNNIQSEHYNFSFQTKCIKIRYFIIKCIIHIYFKNLMTFKKLIDVNVTFDGK